MIFGSGDFKYEVVEDWGTLPSGYELVQESDGTFIKAWKETFNVPHGMRIGPDGNIYLADQGSHLVLKYAPDETLILKLGNPDQPSDTGKTQIAPASGGDGFLVEKPGSPFNQPTGVAVNSDGDIFVSDGYGNCRVHKFNSNGDLLMSWGVPGIEHPGEFHLPHGIGLDNQGRLLVADRENHRIQLYTQQGEHIDVPELGSRMSILDSDGNLLARWGGEESKESGLFIAPHSAAVDSRGDLYIGEVLEGSRLQKFARV